MDRRDSTVGSPRYRVPRPRGDGPRSSFSRRRVSACSPPARGWTVHLLGHHRRHVVFPARAGMDRRRGASRSPRPGVPRPRGDGPMSGCSRSCAVSCSPPARGWTWVVNSTEIPRSVFPARAGMDRARKGATRSGLRVPRPRGDGPKAAIAVAAEPTCSPPARGWTDGKARDATARSVFPARAGMDRRTSGRCGSARSVPRPRGDGPL